MDKKPSNPRSNKPKASHHGSELFALGSKTGTSREDSKTKNLSKPSISTSGSYQPRHFGLDTAGISSLKPQGKSELIVCYR